jgi:cytochrome c-type biogenesis protein CcmE
MNMTPRRRRMVLVGLIVLGVGAATAFALTAFKENLLYYYPPTDVTAGKAPADRVFRLGGMVEEGSLKRETGSMEVRFVVTDFQNDVTVSYTGVLPDLFREGQGVVAHGRIGTDGVFIADEVLAKHDEKYMPPEVARSLKDKGQAYVPGSAQKQGAAAQTMSDAPPATAPTQGGPSSQATPPSQTYVPPTSSAQAPANKPAGT